jgi:hypothetical protein
MIEMIFAAELLGRGRNPDHCTAVLRAHGIPVNAGTRAAFAKGSRR